MRRNLAAKSVEAGDYERFRDDAHGQSIKKVFHSVQKLANLSYLLPEAFTDTGFCRDRKLAATVKNVEKDIERAYNHILAPFGGWCTQKNLSATREL